MELYPYDRLCVTNSIFQTKPQHSVSWRQPRSKHWHQLEMVIVRRTSLKHALLTRSYHSAICDCDHLLVCCKIKLLPKKPHRFKHVGKPLIDTTKMQHPQKFEEFTKSLEDALAAGHPRYTGSESWNRLRKAIQRLACAIFGRKTSKNCDWFDGKSAELTLRQCPLEMIRHCKTTLLQPLQDTLR